MSGVLVHEWLAPTGGSENVFEELSRIFPDAARYCLWNTSDGRFAGVAETWLARTPLRGHKAAAVPLMPFAWRALPALEADWVLCSSHLFAHHARFAGPARGAPKLVYAHTPARYIWTPELDQRGAGPLARLAAAALKPLDRRRAQEPVAIAANSRFVADRVARAWDREATVIYPPVDTSRFAAGPAPTEKARAVLAGLPADFLLVVSRWVSYKRVDAAIRVGLMTGHPVVVAGQGPDEARLREIAAQHPGRVVIVGHPPRAVLRALYQRAAALVFPAVEDFGIVAVEAMAAGTPVLVNAVGGAGEAVVDGVTGAHVRDWESPTEVRAALERALTATAAACRARAAEFDRAAFGDRIRAWVHETTA
ncbi:MAG: glycosyltransferase [Microbacterium sp.]